MKLYNIIDNSTQEFMKINKLLLAINPNSGPDDHELSEYINSIKEIFPTQELLVVDLSQKKNVQESFSDFQPDLVIIGGGDGTLTEIVSLLQDEQVLFAVLPLGSANGFAKCIGISTIEDAYEVLKLGRIKPVDAVFLNDKLSLHLADFGFNANLIKNFEEEEDRGMLSYLKSAAPEILNTEAQPYRMEIDGKVIDFSSKIVVIANGDRYGTGAQINPEGDIGDGYVDIISINPEVLGDYLTLSVAFFNGSLKAHKSVQHWRTNYCKISNLNFTAFQIDGDSEGHPAEVVVRIIPSKFQFLIGMV
jgi:diacylglycerol kinase (ATP)